MLDAKTAEGVVFANVVGENVDAKTAEEVVLFYAHINLPLFHFSWLGLGLD